MTSTEVRSSSFFPPVTIIAGSTSTCKWKDQRFVLEAHCWQTFFYCWWQTLSRCFLCWQVFSTSKFADVHDKEDKDGDGDQIEEEEADDGQHGTLEFLVRIQPAVADLPPGVLYLLYDVLHYLATRPLVIFNVVRVIFRTLLGWLRLGHLIVTRWGSCCLFTRSPSSSW